MWFAARNVVATLLCGGFASWPKATHSAKRYIERSVHIATKGSITFKIFVFLQKFFNDLSFGF